MIKRLGVPVCRRKPKMLPLLLLHFVAFQRTDDQVWLGPNVQALVAYGRANLVPVIAAVEYNCCGNRIWQVKLLPSVG